MKGTAHASYFLGPPVQPGQFYVYGLFCPVARQLRYVGSTCNAPLKRYAQHIHQTGKANPDKSQWISALKRIGEQPYIRVLKVLPTQREAWAWEECMIACFRGRRALCNQDNRFGSCIANSETFKLSHPWLGTRQGMPIKTDWSSLLPDPIRQRLTPKLRRYLIALIKQVGTSAFLLKYAAELEAETRPNAPVRKSRENAGHTLAMMADDWQKHIDQLLAIIQN